jgi:hypothetical protein
MRISLFLLGLLTAGGVLAEPDTFGLGTGRNGPLLVEAPDTVINRYGQLTASVTAGAEDLTVSNASAFVAGELVLIHQSTGLLPAPASGDQRTLNLSSSSSVGRFEYARVSSVTEASLQLTAPLLNGYAANVTQVVSVPEYTEVQVLAGASVRARPWNGSVGGILALLATGTLTNEGIVTVAGAGFRGGAFVNHPSLYDCTSLDEAAGSGGSYKGEGLVAGRFGTAAGRGNLANGGGSGNCHSAGGAGGGHSGAGGKGGRTVSENGNQDVGGLGGVPVLYQPYERLLFGGGGGAGAGHMDFGTAGAAGGGLMLIRAGAVAGTGRFSAKGASADFVPSAIDDGAGGGGAGGAISLRVAQGLSCGLAEAAGGAGGDTRHPTSESGPGGGGGGGVVLLQGESISCPASVVAGLPGQSTAGGGTLGAGPAVIDSGSSYGLEQTFLLPFRLPATPLLAHPDDGAVFASPRPKIEGTAEPGVIVHVLLDGGPFVQLGAGPDGAFSFTPSKDLAPGKHELKVSAEVLGIRGLESAPVRFDIVTAVGDGGTPDGGEPEEPMRPILVVPAEGERVDPTPLFAGTSPVGVQVGIEVDELEVARVPLDEEGRFRYTLRLEQALAPGAHHVIARAWDDAGQEVAASSKTGFEVVKPEELEVGCGCGASPGASLGALALLLGLWAGRRRLGK